MQKRKREFMHVETLSGKRLKYVKIGDLYFNGYKDALKTYDPEPLLEALPKMNGRDDDVFVVGCRRSGTNWTWEIVSMLAKEAAEYQKGRKRPTILEHSTQEFFEKMASPRVLSTHLQFHHIPDDIKNRKCKIVYVQRNPKDVCVSFHKFLQSEMNSEIPWNDYVNLFANADEANYHFWIGITLGWDKAITENPDYPILLVYYEKMKQNPYGEIRRIAEFLGVSTDEAFINDVVHKTQFTNMRTAKLEFLSEETKTMSADDAKKARESREKYYRKGEVADWKNHFTVAQNEYFDKIMNERLKNTSLEFIYNI